MEITIKELWKNKKLIRANANIIYLSKKNYEENKNLYYLDERFSANFEDEFGNRKRSIVDFSISKYDDINAERFIKPNRKVFVDDLKPPFKVLSFSNYPNEDSTTDINRF
jgi:hypothetical protein|tara:strand:+ start:708 stop:1037 length:330 start_codon:yes stop_codon:yes gene_type:complete